MRLTKAGVSSATMSTQLAVDDAFLLSYNLENLSASRRGYDITSQDPFFLIDNPKSEVFAEAAAYAIQEKRTVPLDSTLLPIPDVSLLALMPQNIL